MKSRKPYHKESDRNPQSLFACVASARKNGRTRGRRARGEGAPSPFACLPLARPFFLAPTTSKRLLRRLGAYIRGHHRTRGGSSCMGVFLRHQCTPLSTQYTPFFTSHPGDNCHICSAAAKGRVFLQSSLKKGTSRAPGSRESHFFYRSKVSGSQLGWDMIGPSSISPNIGQQNCIGTPLTMNLSCNPTRQELRSEVNLWPLIRRIYMYKNYLRLPSREDINDNFNPSLFVNKTRLILYLATITIFFTIFF